MPLKHGTSVQLRQIYHSHERRFVRQGNNSIGFIEDRQQSGLEAEALCARCTTQGQRSATLSYRPFIHGYAESGEQHPQTCSAAGLLARLEKMGDKHVLLQAW